jgi:hypothetical protein
MSVIAFRPFMTVTVEEQGTRKSIAALVFTPTIRTTRRLADHKLVFRRRANGFQLYAQHNVVAGDVRLAPIATRTSFQFRITLNEPDFLDRYHPDLNQATGPCLYLCNVDEDGTVRASGSISGGSTVEQGDAARIVGRRLISRADLTRSPKPTSLRVTDRHAPSRTVANVPIDATPGAESATVAIDLTEDAGNAYTLKPQPGGSPQAALFADDEMAARGAFGALELVARPFPGPSPSAGRLFTATFRRRS